MMIPNANIVQSWGSCLLDMDSFLPEPSPKLSCVPGVKYPEQTGSKQQDINVDSVFGVP
jgi:hypothetical protein